MVLRYKFYKLTLSKKQLITVKSDTFEKLLLQIYYHAFLFQIE